MEVWVCLLVPAIGCGGEAEADRVLRLGGRATPFRLRVAAAPEACRLGRNPPGEVRCELPPSPGSSQFEELAGIARRARRLRGDTPEVLHAKAMALLVWPGASGEAVDLLRRAWSLQRTRVVGNDLAVGLFVDGIEGRRPRQSLAALELFEELDATQGPDCLTTPNRAYVLGALGLTIAATETRQRVALLGCRPSPAESRGFSFAPRDGERELAAARPGPSRRARAEHLLADLLALADVEDVGHRLVELTAAARQLAGHGDSHASLMVDEAGLIPGSRRGRWNEAARSLRRGLDLVEAGEYSEAAVELGGARSALRGLAPILALEAELQLARAEYLAGRSDRAIETSRRVLDEAIPGRLHALAGRAWWIVGTASLARSDPASSRAAFERAAEEFLSIGDQESAAAVTLRRANAHAELGDHEGARAARLEALRALEAAPAERERRLVLTDMAYDALDLGLGRAAERLQGEALAIAQRRGEAYPLAMARLHLATILRRSSREEEAARQLQLATEDLPSLGATAGEVRGRVALERARLGIGVPGDRPDEALAAADDWLSPLLIPDLLTERARLFALRGDTRRAKAELEKALALVEAEGGRISSAEDQASFAASRARAHEALLSLTVATDPDPGRSLAIASRREALENVAEPGTALRRIALAPGSALLFTEVLDDRLLLWWVQASSVELESVPIPRSEVIRLVEAVESGTSSPRASRALTRLGEVLLGPFQRRLSRLDRLLVMPDEALWGLPFAALRDPSSGGDLVDRAAVLVLDGLPRQKRPWPSAGISLGVVANVAQDEALFPGLPRIGDDAQLVESLSVARVSRLSGTRATPAAVLGLLGRADVTHIAAHAVANSERPLSSYLVLAADGDRGGALYGKDLLGLPRRVRNLVVLAACRSAGRGPAGGPAGLVSPLLESGAEYVVASLWEADDRDTTGFFAEFYAALESSGDPVAALRTAQLRSRGGDGLAWATFEIFG